MKYLIIYPNDEQIKRINDKYSQKDITIITKNNYKHIDNIEDYKIMCCNEEAIYFLHKYKDQNIELMFNKECLEFHLKMNSYCSFSNNNINCIEKNYKIESFPSIAKPNFGFASYGVKKIKNDEGLINYEKNVKKNIQDSVISIVKENYFTEISNQIIYERPIENSIFYSVPFIYNNGDIIVFPIKGTKKLKNSYTDYYWTEFTYDNSNMNDEIKEKIYNLLKKVADKYINNNSVNMAEVLYDKNKKEVYLVEFSPRVPGGKLSKMIELGNNLNLNYLSIDMFFNNKLKSINIKGDTVKLRLLFKEDNIPYDIEEEKYSSIFNNNIKYRFYLKNKKVGLIPGRFAPIHKGHQYMIESGIKMMDQIVILIFDTKDTVVPLKTRADWMRFLYPEAIVIEGYNCPDGVKYAYENGLRCERIQNKYIEKMVENEQITHVIHSTTYGDSVAAYLGAKSVMIDLNRSIIPISGTEIRKNPILNRKYISKYVFNEYIKYEEKENHNTNNN